MKTGVNARRVEREGLIKRKGIVGKCKVN